MSAFLLTCGSDGLESLSYGDCRMGDRRCSGTKLEICTDYKEWKLETECADFDGTCISDDGSPHCNVEVEEIPDEIVIFEDEEEDDNAPQMLDNFGSYPGENDEDQDDGAIETDDEMTDPDIENDYDHLDTDEDQDDTDSDDTDSDDVEADDSDIISVCGNGILEGDEICEKNYIKPCVEINPVKFSGGNAICDETCMDYNTVTCVE